jgi:U3 small nucleolar RNA-associated protein 14
MESAVTALLNSANLNSTQVAQAEDDALMGQDLSMEEIAARRADLRHQRELLFRAEARSKRVSKIKSKTFRKLARKRDEKNQVDLEDLQRLDPQKAEEEAMKLEALRAKERATLKHSAKSGRWARDQHGAGETQDKRLEMEEMLRQKERLTRKIRGHGSDDDDNETSDEDEDPIESAYDQLADLRRKEAELSEEAATKTKGIMGMKFMQRAMARDQAKVDAEAAELQKQLEDYEAGRDASEEDDEDEDEAGNVLRIKNNPGRLAFGGVPAGSAAAPGAFTAAPVQDAATESSHTLGSPREEYHSTISKPQLQAEATNEDDEDVNPWLTGAKQTGRARKNNVVIAGKDISAVDRSVAKQKKVKAQNAKHVAVEDAEVDIDLDPKSLLAGKKSMPLEDGDADSDEEELNKKGPKAFKQRDLVAQAFAGDNVIEVRCLSCLSCPRLIS